MANDFICPSPTRWNEIYEALCKRYECISGKKLSKTVSERPGTGGPPIPLILAGWVFTSDDDKRQRWLETIQWAKGYGLLEFLTVEQKDRYYSAGYTRRGGIHEYSKYTERIISDFQLEEYVTLNEYLQNPDAVRTVLPNEKGIYFVIYPYICPDDDFMEVGTGGHFKGRDPNVPIKVLWENWVEDADILYIGRAGGVSKNGIVSNAVLKERIMALLHFGNGKNVGHWGGRLLWQHDKSHDFRVYWHRCQENENPVTQEGSLIDDFEAHYNKKPFANLE